jgi:hypothetical protein
VVLGLLTDDVRCFRLLIRVDGSLHALKEERWSVSGQSDDLVRLIVFVNRDFCFLVISDSSFQYCSPWSLGS